MSDPADYTRQIELGKLIVTRYIKARPDSANQIYAMRRLPQDADALARNLWRLQLFLGDRFETISFPVENLADAPGKPDGDGVLKQRGDQSLGGVQNRGRGGHVKEPVRKKPGRKPVTRKPKANQGVEKIDAPEST